MSNKTINKGFVYVTSDGKFIRQGSASSHGTDRLIYWDTTDDIDSATIFPNENVNYAKRGLNTSNIDVEEIVAIPAYSYRIVRFGRGLNV